MKILFTIFFSVILINSFGQIGGNYVYDFLSLPISPRSASLGGSAIAINDGDISLATENPALFSDKTDGKITLQYFNYVSDISLGFASYSRSCKNIGTFAVGIEYLNGGSFTEADENGYELGSFGVSETAINLSYSKSFDSIFSIGATVKPVFSHLAQYKSFGLVMDVGAAYTSKDKLFTAAVLFKNMGAQITKYIDESYPVPFEIQAGFSQKLAHAPFRFSVIVHNIETPKLSYKQTNYPEPSNMPQTHEEQKAATVMQEVMNHMIFGIEFVPTKSFFIRLGYNYMRQQELMIANKPGIVGFSWGFGFRISKFHFSFANAKYHLAGASNQISITTNLNDFFK